MTAKFAGAANIPFLLLQLPQIVLNTRNLLAGNKTALFAVPWLVRPPNSRLRFHLLCVTVSAVTIVLSDLIARFRECSLGC